MFSYVFYIIIIICSCICPFIFSTSIGSDYSHIQSTAGRRHGLYWYCCAYTYTTMKNIEQFSFHGYRNKPKRLVLNIQAMTKHYILYPNSMKIKIYGRYFREKYHKIPIFRQFFHTKYPGIWYFNVVAGVAKILARTIFDHTP